MRLSKLRFPMSGLLLLLAVVTACGSPFVKGWRADPATDDRSPEDRCKASEGHSWVGGVCSKNSDLKLTDIDSEEQCKHVQDAGWFDGKCLWYSSLNETQCGQVNGWAWGKKGGADVCMPAAEAACLVVADHQYVGGRCLDRPQLELSGAPLTQAVAAGSAMQPLDVKAAPGAQIDLRHITEGCDGFFKLDGGKLTSGPAELKDAQTKTCAVDVVARVGAAESTAVRVAVTISQGFLGYCTGLNDASREPELRSVRATVIAMKIAVAKPDCTEADKALADLPELNLTLEKTGVVISDLRPLAGLTKLAWLHLEGNDVRSLKPLAALTHLEYIGMGNNPLGLEVKKTEDNCPTGDTVSPGVRAFCRGQAK